MHYANVAVILHFATPEGLSEEQASQAVNCFLRQQGNCEPLPIDWSVGVPVEAEETAAWVMALKAKALADLQHDARVLLTPFSPWGSRAHGWLD